MSHHPKYQKWTKIRFRISGSTVEVEGVTMFCNWRAETDTLYYITKSTDPAHPGYYRVYPGQMCKVYAPPPRADGRAFRTTISP